MTQEIAKSEDVKVVKSKITGMQKAVEAVDITDAEAVKGMVSNIKKLLDFVEQKKDTLVSPAKAIIEEAKEIYDPFINACKDAKRTLTDRAMQHVLAERKKEEDEKARILADKRTKVETKVDKLAEVQETKKTHGGVTVSMRPDIEIVDESQIPQEYWIKTLNTAMIRKAVITEGLTVPGVNRIEKPVGGFSSR